MSGLFRNVNGNWNPNHNPKLKKDICIIKKCPIKRIEHKFSFTQTISSLVAKVYNVNKINEYLDLFGTEMGLKNRILPENYRKTSAS